jgi:predicted methyltransferase
MLMRTTLDIEDDVLLAAKELARRGGTTAGRVISHLLRQALTQSTPSTTSSTSVPVTVHGFRPFPSRGKVVTNEQVDQLRDEEGV